MRLVMAIGLVGVLVVSGGCGKSAEQKAAEEAAENARVAAEELKKAAESAAAAGTAAGAAGAAAGLEAFSKAMEGAAGAMAGRGPDGKPIEPVSFRELQTALPEVSGWTREEPTGERMTMPVPFSQTEARYTMGDSSVEVKIVDTAFNQILVAPFAMLLTTGYEKESTSGYEKATTVAGNPGFERWDKDSKDGELTVVVAKRFLVSIEGNEIGDTKVLQEFASKLDMGKLAAFK
jgi:hypothetical protein